MVAEAAHDVIVILVFIVGLRGALHLLLLSCRSGLLRAYLLARHFLLQELDLLQLLLIRLL